MKAISGGGFSATSGDNSMMRATFPIVGAATTPPANLILNPNGWRVEFQATQASITVTVLCVP
jgi:hypothetical protein